MQNNCVNDVVVQSGNPEEYLKQKQQEFFNQIYRIECEVLDGGQLPNKKNPKDAGFDLYATEDITLYPGQVIKHPLNIKLKLPNDTWAEITTKSGLGAKGQLVFAGVIDEEYRGIPHVVMTNVNSYVRTATIDDSGAPHALPVPIVIKKGEKVAQMIMNPHSQHYFIEQVAKVETDTARGEGGFGSTGA